jgi:hypothetical protein
MLPTAMSKATRWKTKAAEADNTGMETAREKTPTKQNATGAGYTIPTGLPTAITAIIPRGSTTDVFDAKLRAIHECLLTCLRYIRLHRLHRRHIHIFTDNQAAISRSAGLHWGPGQETAYYIHYTSLKLRLYATSITIHWVPGHTDIPGNESADSLAKLATTIQTTWQLPISIMLDHTSTATPPPCVCNNQH